MTIHSHNQRLNRLHSYARWPILFLLLLVVLFSTVRANADAATTLVALRSEKLAQRGRIAANNLQESISHLEKQRWTKPGQLHKHLNFMNSNKKQKNTERETNRKPAVSVEKGTLEYALRVGLAGGLAGAAGTLALYPLDSAKTLRQSEPSLFPNVRSALLGLCYSNGKWHIRRAYRGVIPSALGAVPSSALYFGAYESMKLVLRRTLFHNSNNNNDDDGHPSTTMGRLGMHSMSAACGNILSSLVFVPKEAMKQHMQYMGNANMAQAAAHLCRTRGLTGMYTGYQATLLRNIPTAAIRFTVYEELRHIWMSKMSQKQKEEDVFHWGLFGAGAVAGIMASAFMTPVDVLKTRIATGTCPVDLPSCAQHVFRENGVGALYAGAGSRMLASAAFSAIGFGVFEAAKIWLNVADIPKSSGLRKPHPVRRMMQNFTVRQRRLDHALTDACVDKKQQ